MNKVQKSTQNIMFAFSIMLSLGLLITSGLAFLKNLYFVFIVYYLIYGMLIPFGDLVLVQKKPLKKWTDFLNITPLPTSRQLLFALGVGIVIYSGIVGLFILLNDILLDEQLISQAVEQWGISSRLFPLVFAILLIFNGAVEELFWRGYIHKKLEVMPQRFPAIFAGIFFFTAQHIFIILQFTSNPVAFAILMAGIAAGGIIFSLLREKTGNVLPAMIAHVCATAGYMTAFGLYIL